jgi:DNA processing protein
LIVVSGLARGIDAAAHAASLPQGTIGVHAGGVDVICPAENTNLPSPFCKRARASPSNPLDFTDRAIFSQTKSPHFRPLPGGCNFGSGGETWNLYHRKASA